MAAKKKSAAPKENKITYAHGNKLFEKLGVAKVRSFIEKHFPNRKVAPSGTAKLLVQCLMPDHPDHHPSCLIDCNKGYAKCFSCGYFSRNLLQLLQDSKGWTFKESVAQLQAVAGFAVVTEKVAKELDDLDVHQSAYRLLFRVCNEHLLNCISPPEDDPDYSVAFLDAVRPTLEWLFEERKHLKDYVAHCAYGVFPPHHMTLAAANKILTDMASEQLAQVRPGDPIALTPERRSKILKRIEHLIKHADGSWVHAVTFHNGYALTTPGRMRLRRPHQNKDDNLLMLPGFTDNDPTGWFGLHASNFNVFRVEELDKFMFLMVEGENDAISIQEHLVERGITGVFVIASCGNHNTNTDMLVAAGINRVYLLGDEPSPDFGKGEAWVMDRLVSACEIDARVFVRWDTLRQDAVVVKDPDDVVHVHGFQHLYKTVVEEAALSFVAVDTWAFDRVIDAVRGIDESETRARQAKAVEYGQCVRHPALLGSYIEKVSTTLGLPSGPLRSEIVQAKDSEAGFIARIAETIRHEFHVCYKEDNARGGQLYLYHKRSRRDLLFVMTDGPGMLASLSNIFGDMYTYFKDFIGLPPTYGDDNTDELPHTALIRERQKDLGEYIKIAMQSVYKDVPAKAECIKIGQGIHLLPDPEREDEKVLYVINGRRVYRCRWLKPGIPHLTAEELLGPTDGRYLFAFSEKPWSKEITCAGDLEWGNGIDLDQIRGLSKDLTNLFDKCFRWVHQDTDPSFLANHLIACTIHAAFPTKVITGFLGRSTSGKSTAMSFFDGGQVKPLQLLEAAENRANYSAASIYQDWNHSALSMGLQEFEQSGDTRTHKGQAVENINELLRQVIFDEGATVSRGTANGSTQSYHIHTNVFLTSIQRALHAQDENRRFNVETIKVDGLKDPALAVYDHVSVERFKQMRRLATLGLLKYALELSKHHQQVYAEMNNTPLTAFNVPTRFLRNFVPMASIMTLIGEDWKPLVIKICENRKDTLAAVAKDNASANIHARIMHTNNISIGSHGKGSLLTMLAKEEHWKMINTANAGVFYDDERKLLIIDWVAATSPGGLLYRSDEGRSSYRNLKYILDQHDNAVKGRDYTQAGVYLFLRTIGMVMEENEVSAIRIGELVAAIRAGQTPTTPMVPGAATAVEASVNNV